MMMLFAKITKLYILQVNIFKSMNTQIRMYMVYMCMIKQPRHKFTKYKFNKTADFNTLVHNMQTDLVVLIAAYIDSIAHTQTKTKPIFHKYFQITSE